MMCACTTATLAHLPMPPPLPIPLRIPIKAVDADAGACAAAEPFALQVLGDAMAPEFNEGDIIIVEPEGHAADGAYVLAWANDEWIFRQLRRRDDGWALFALNPGYAPIELPDLQAVRGVIIQKSRPGRRRETRRYVD
jgi:SOS-response transcriptional repressor LexA